MNISGSAVTLGGVCVSPISSIILIKFGHKTCCQVALIGSFIFWLMIVTTPYVSLLLLARFLVGMCTTTLISSTDLYIIETSHESVRGVVMIFLSTARYLGSVFIFAIGISMLWWRVQALICCFLTIVPLILLIFFPTSPRYLASLGKKDEVRKSLSFYRGSKYDISTEFNKLEKIFEDDVGSEGSIPRQFSYMIKTRVRKIVGICLLIAFGTQIAGQGAVLAYAGPIMKESMPNFNPYYLSLIIAIMRVLGSLIFLSISNKIPRRLTFLLSGLVSVISLSVFSTHLYLIEKEIDLFPWFIPILFISLLMISTAIFSPVGFLIIGEILPTNCRSLGYVLGDMACLTSYFLTVASFPILRDIISPYGVFWSFASILFVIILIPFTFIPETHGKNLEDIQMKLYNKE